MAAAIGCLAATLAAQSAADLSAVLRQAQASIREGRDTDARRLIADAEARLNRIPESDRLDPWTQLGLAYLLLGESREAARAFTTSSTLARKHDNNEIEWRAEEGLGRAALQAHDPQRAIAYLQRAVEIVEQAPGGRRDEAPYKWLAVALMMQSASPDDAYVERAFSAAAHRTRGEAVASLENGDALVQYLVGDENAYAWVLTRDRMVGFELPAPATLQIDVERALKYIGDRDRDGLDRISDELTPAVLGPLLDILPSLKKIMIAPDGALARLPFAALKIGDDYLGERVALSVEGSGSQPTVTPWPLNERGPQHTRTVIALSIVAALAIVAVLTFSRRARRRSRAPS